MDLLDLLLDLICVTKNLSFEGFHIIKAALRSTQDFLRDQNVGILLELSILVDLVVQELGKDCLGDSFAMCVVTSGAGYLSLTSTHCQLLLSFEVMAANRALLPLCLIPALCTRCFRLCERRCCVCVARRSDLIPTISRVKEVRPWLNIRRCIYHCTVKSEQVSKSKVTANLLLAKDASFESRSSESSRLLTLISAALITPLLPPLVLMSLDLGPPDLITVNKQPKKY